MKRLILTLFVLILALSVTSAQNPLIVKYNGNGVIGGAGMLPSEAYKARDVVISKLEQNFTAILVEYKPNNSGKFRPRIGWIYLNDINNPRDYIDVSNIESDYLGTVDLFCINLSFRLRLILRFFGVKCLFKTIGVDYYVDEEGNVISNINYNKLEKFV
ncbi:hypothetical protein J6V86_02250 [bacterium]|nr:hypothetical protein [bacterium]